MNKEQIQKGVDSNTYQQETLQKYLEIVSRCRNELDALYKTTNDFKLSQKTDAILRIHDKEFKISTSVSYSSITKNKSDPRIWYLETLCPGNPTAICETIRDCKNRLKWDLNVSCSKKIPIDHDANDTNLQIAYTATKPAAGGIISPRDFVDLSDIYPINDAKTGYEATQLVGVSVECDEVPEKKGFVRGNTLISGFLMEKLSTKELKERYNICESQCEWSRMKYIVQSDIKGWIPKSVLNAAFASSICEYVNNLRNYVINNTQ